MKCPACSTIDLMMADRQGVEIDYCPQCRGIWLDRGELDKLIERASQHYGSEQSRQPSRESGSHNNNHQSNNHQSYDSHNSSHSGHHPHKKKESRLSEVFDIF